MLVLVDVSGLRLRLSGQAGADRRLAERRAAWQRVLDGAGVASAAIDLTAPDAALPAPLRDALRTPTAGRGPTAGRAP